MNYFVFELPALLILLNDQVSRRGQGLLLRVCDRQRILELVQFLTTDKAIEMVAIVTKDIRRKRYHLLLNL